MKHVARSQAVKHMNNPACTVFEYGAGKGLDLATATIHGRYPVQNFVVNEACEESIYVTSGSGSLVTKEIRTTLRPGDAAFIAINEPYYFEGKELEMVIVCTPPFDPHQHKEAI